MEKERDKVKWYLTNIVSVIPQTQKIPKALNLT